MSTRKRDRFFALFGALLFLGSASALTIAIVVQNIENRHQSNANSAQATTPPTNTTKGNKLQGTKLTNYSPQAKITQLQTIDLITGSGPAVKASDTVTVDYTGAVAATGIIFQSSLDSGQPATFPLNQVIKGWTQGIPGMKVGGTRRLLIPAALAYGSNPPPSSNIPANADLVFDVTLHKIGS